MIDIAKEIAQALKEFTSEVEEGIETAKEKVAKEAAEELRQTSPKKSGAYARSWKAKKVGKVWIVHNVRHYRLTHLLENGHAKVGGGRVEGEPHIYPAEQRAIKIYLKDVEKVIRG